MSSLGRPSQEQLGSSESSYALKKDVLPPLDLYPWDKIDEKFLLSRATHDNMQLKNWDKIAFTIRRKLVPMYGVETEHRMILPCYKQKMEEEFTGEDLEKHSDGEHFYWSKNKHNVYVAIFRWGNLEKVYYCKEVHILAMRVDKKYGFTAIHENPVNSGPILPDMSTWEELSPIIPSDNLKKFSDQHILDPLEPSCEDYEAWDWTRWKEYLLDGKPKLAQSQAQGSGKPTVHVIIIGSTNMMERENPDIPKIEGWLNRPREVYYFVLNSAKEIQKAYRHLKAYVQTDENYQLKKTATTPNGTDINPDICEEVPKEGKPPKFVSFLTKHVLDPNSWEAAVNGGIRQWDFFDWNTFVITRRKKLKIPSMLNSLKTILLKSETEVRGIFQGPGCTKTKRGAHEFVWSKIPVDTVALFPAGLDWRYGTARKCGQLFVAVRLEEKLPVHLEAVSRTKKLGESYDEWTINCGEDIRGSGRKLALPTVGWLGEGVPTSGPGGARGNAGGGVPRGANPNQGSYATGSGYPSRGGYAGGYGNRGGQDTGRSGNQSRGGPRGGYAYPNRGGYTSSGAYQNQGENTFAGHTQQNDQYYGSQSEPRGGQGRGRGRGRGYSRY